MTDIAYETAHRNAGARFTSAGLISLTCAAATGFALILGTNWVVATALNGLVVLLAGA